MRHFLHLFNKNFKNNKFNSIKIELASPKKIISWSNGEVKKSETINYRTFKAEKDGLFCPKIFGPVKDYECLCGKYKRSKFLGVICEKCGVEVSLSSIRRERMGHIILAIPVAHIWFLRSLPSRLALILDVNLKDLEKVLYFESYIIIDPGETYLKKFQVITEEEFFYILKVYGNNFKAVIGSEGIYKILCKINIDIEIENLKTFLKKNKSSFKAKKFIKRLKIFKSFKKFKMRPEWMFLKVLPILPPELRPLVPIEGGRFASSDLNDLYRRVINRNNRLKRLLILGAPEIIQKNEKRMLQESVDALFDNGRRSKVVLGSNKRPLKSLSEMIKGKNGRFRQNLLGKRVDYSGRSVIVVGPELSLEQCGIPKLMALELFKLFVFEKLKDIGLVISLQFVKKILGSKNIIIWEILEKIVKEFPIILNRAPTLHRLGIQAFKPVLIEGKAIKLHPLVCTAFNADFDGDQMAVHIPLSIQARAEANSLMLSTKNILFPSNGEPSIVPTQDIVLGIYYATQKNKNKKFKKIFGNVYEIFQAYEAKVVNLSTSIIFRVYEKNSYFLKDLKKETYDFKRYNTTVGRVMLYEILPKGLPFSLINKTFNKKKLSKLISIIFERCGISETVLFVDKLMKYGFNISTISGITISIDDMIIPKEKDEIIMLAKEKIKKNKQRFLHTLISSTEYYSKTIDIWNKASNDVKKKLIIQLKKKYIFNKRFKNFYERSFNAIFMMLDSGARGSESQVHQLAGMRGLMLKPDGTIIETPILSNFREGLSVLEYFISTHGARKGLADTALKTANSGYLTRRLVDVTQDLVITENDCYTKEGFIIKCFTKKNKIIRFFRLYVFGRILIDDIINPKNKKILFYSGKLIDEDVISKIKLFNIKKIKIRTPLKCKTAFGICVKCYGRDLARGKLVNIGEAIGVIAAQSIGEPGTQLTMRTFHIGGVISGNLKSSTIESKYDGIIGYSENTKYILNTNNNLIVISTFGEILIFDKFKKVIEHYKVPYGTILNFSKDVFIKAGEELAFWDPTTKPVVSEFSGYIKFKNIIEGKTLLKKNDSFTGTYKFIIIENRNLKISNSKNSFPKIKILEKFYNKDKKYRNNKKFEIKLNIGSEILVVEKQFVNVGDIIARIPIKIKKINVDITGGLTKISELFEARIMKNTALLAEISGILSYGINTKKKIFLKIIGKKEFKYKTSLFRDRQVLVKDGEYVKKGDILVAGTLNPHDILRLLGINVLSKYIINKVQNIYHSQGVKINNKHIEIIIRQMLRKVQIVSKGDTKYIVGEQVERIEVLKINNLMISKNKCPAKYKNILLGITKASLSTNSFISAASFQETTRVLTESAVMAKRDKLYGLKENVVVGRLIPAGTGLIFHKFFKK